MDRHRLQEFAPERLGIAAAEEGRAPRHDHEAGGDVADARQRHGHAHRLAPEDEHGLTDLRAARRAQDEQVRARRERERERRRAAGARRLGAQRVAALDVPEHLDRSGRRALDRDARRLRPSRPEPPVVVQGHPPERVVARAEAPLPLRLGRVVRQDGGHPGAHLRPRRIDEERLLERLEGRGLSRGDPRRARERLRRVASPVGASPASNAA